MGGSHYFLFLHRQVFRQEGNKPIKAMLKDDSSSSSVFREPQDLPTRSNRERGTERRRAEISTSLHFTKPETLLCFFIKTKGLHLSNFYLCYYTYATKEQL